MSTEGQKVQYVGEDTLVGIGTLGKVVAASGRSSHVQWLAGIREGQIELVSDDDLVPVGRDAMSVAAQFDDSLDTPVMTTVAVRDTYDELGEDGLLNSLAESGHLASLGAYAQDAVGIVATSLRHDPTFAAVLADLDADEAESLVQRVTSGLLTAAITEEG